MKNIRLILFLLFISINAFSQGSFCSRNTGAVSDNNFEKSELSKNIEKAIANSNIAEFLLNLNSEITRSFSTIQRQNLIYLQQRNCLLEPGFCSAFAIEVFGYFQDGIFSGFDFSLTIDNLKQEGLSTQEITDYLKRHYNDHTTFVDITPKPSELTEEHLDLKIAKYLNANGKHGILSFDYLKKSNNEKYGHAINVFKLNDNIYYVNDNNPISTSINPVLSLRRDSDINKLVLVELIYIPDSSSLQ